jgi:ribosomal protein S18 acetylase RimI-like enzyme
MNLRDAVPRDLGELGELEREAFQTDRLSPRSMRRLMASASAIFRVMASDGAVAGYYVTLLRRGGHTARLYSLLVAPQHRGGDAARMLIADAERRAARRGAVSLHLEVREDNARAIRFYERLGYRRIGYRPQYYADNAAALRYEKQLPVGRTEQPADGIEDRSPTHLAINSDPRSMSGTKLPATPESGRRGPEA